MSFAQGMGAGAPLRTSSVLRDGKLYDTMSSSSKGAENISQNNNAEDVGTAIDTTSDKVDLSLEKKEIFEVSLNNSKPEVFNKSDEAFKFIDDNLNSSISIKSFNNGQASRRITLNILQSFSLK